MKLSKIKNLLALFVLSVMFVACGSAEEEKKSTKTLDMQNPKNLKFDKGILDMTKKVKPGQLVGLSVNQKLDIGMGSNQGINVKNNDPSGNKMDSSIYDTSLVNEDINNPINNQDPLKRSDPDLSGLDQFNPCVSKMDGFNSCGIKKYWHCILNPNDPKDFACEAK